MSLDISAIVLLGLGALVSSTFGAMSGFGAGLMVIPFLVPVVGIKGVVPVMTIAMIFGNLMRIWVYRAHVRPRFVALISLAVIPGIILGTSLYDRMSPRMAALVIGAFLLVTIPLRWLLKGRPLAPSRAGTVAVGLGFGVITGATTGAGVILLSLLMGMGLVGPALIATDAVVGVVVTGVKAAMFSGLDLIDRERLLLGIGLGLAMAPGTYLGSWLVRRMPIRAHVALMECVVAGVGLWLLWQAWVGDP